MTWPLSLINVPNQRQKNKKAQKKPVRAPKTRVAPKSKTQTRVVARGITRKPAPQRGMRIKTVRVPHREKLCDVFSGPWHAAYYQLNPAMIATFPWLSQLAENFDQFRIVQLSVEYIPSCPVTTAGRIIMAYEYDVKDDDTGVLPDALMNYQGAIAGAVIDPLVAFYDHKASLDLRHNLFMEAKFPSSDPLRVPANFIYGVTGGDEVNKVLLGELYIDYDIDLLVPQSIPQPLQNNTVHFRASTGNCTDLNSPGICSTAGNKTTKAVEKDHGGTQLANLAAGWVAKNSTLAASMAGTVVKGLTSLVASLLLTQYPSYPHADAGLFHNALNEEELPMTVPIRIGEDVPEGATMYFIEPQAGHYVTARVYLKGNITQTTTGGVPGITWFTSPNVTIARSLNAPDRTVGASWPAGVLSTTVISELQFSITDHNAAWVIPVMTKWLTDGTTQMAGITAINISAYYAAVDFSFSSAPTSAIPVYNTLTE